MTRRASTAETARYTFIHLIGICAVTGTEGPIHVAHIRGADALFGKALAGMARKPHWVWTLPLSPEAHATQHQQGEVVWWSRNGYPWRDITRGPMAAALILEGFRSLDDADGARTWLRERATGELVIAPQEPAMGNVLTRLAKFYTPPEIEVWLTRPHPQIDGEAPLTLMIGGRADEVAAILDRLESGVYL